MSPSDPSLHTFLLWHAGAKWMRCLASLGALSGQRTTHAKSMTMSYVGPRQSTRCFSVQRQVCCFGMYMCVLFWHAHGTIQLRPLIVSRPFGFVSFSVSHWQDAARVRSETSKGGSKGGGKGGEGKAGGKGGSKGGGKGGNKGGSSGEKRKRIVCWTCGDEGPCCLPLACISPLRSQLPSVFSCLLPILCNSCQDMLRLTPFARCLKRATQNDALLWWARWHLLGSLAFAVCLTSCRLGWNLASWRSTR